MDTLMKTLIVDNETKHIVALQKLVTGEVMTVSWKDIPKEIDMFNLIVLSGSYTRAVVGREKETYDMQRRLFEKDIPIIGICAGFELLIDYFGGRLVRREERIHGIIPLTKITG